MEISTNVTDKLPSWFKAILFVLFCILIIVLLRMYFQNMDDKMNQATNDHAKTGKKIDTLSAKMHADNSKLKASAVSSSKQATTLTKKIQHEKNIFSNPGTDSIARYIAEYRYSE
ncbi:hypothetical protein [Flavobacterium sp.]|uniref:hypothetical protein n=1 Tax=Flavobacterium sp. TaxID=239 RepID=UPI0026055AD7|nr:hypothetical protein [Flavobacterium sp.]